MSAGELALMAAAAAAISAALIVALRPLLVRYAMATPNLRSSHRTATPQGGGVAVICAVVAVAAAAAFRGYIADAAMVSLLVMLAATAFIAIVGAADDLHALAVTPRLLMQAAAVAVVLAALPSELRVLPMLPWWIERALLLVAGLWFVNLTNFMDGIDWMTVVEFVPITAGLVLLGFIGALPNEGIVVAAALGGALIGFAPFNRPVARIFLGDVGSLPIGLLAGWLLLLLASRGHLVAALILPLYYLADATLTLLRRMFRREPFWQAHRTHFYQRATDRGYTVTEVVGRVCAVNLGLVALATATLVWPNHLAGVIALASAAALVAWLLRDLARGRS